LDNKVFAIDARRKHEDYSLMYWVTEKKETLEKHSGSHVQLAALQNRELELQTTSPF